MPIAANPIINTGDQSPRGAIHLLQIVLIIFRGEGTRKTPSPLEKFSFGGGRAGGDCDAVEGGERGGLGAESA